MIRTWFFLITYSEQSLTNDNVTIYNVKISLWTRFITVLTIHEHVLITKTSSTVIQPWLRDEYCQILHKPFCIHNHIQTSIRISHDLILISFISFIIYNICIFLWNNFHLTIRVVMNIFNSAMKKLMYFFV